MITRRRLGASLLAAPLLSVHAARAEEDALYEAAKKEGAFSWYSGILDQPICDRITQAFSKKYPGIACSSVKTTSQVAFQRVLQDLKAGQPQCDLLTSTDLSHMAYLKGKGLLVRTETLDESMTVAAFRNVDPEGFYHATYVGLVTLLYNSDKVSATDAPKNWTDLSDPKWRGKIAFGSPAYSGMVGVWSVAMAQRYGWTYFDGLSKQSPQIGRSIDDAVTTLNSGERIVAMGAVATGLRSRAKGNPIGIVYPTDGTIGVVTASAVIKGARNVNAGKLFLSFLLGREHGEIMSDIFEQPLRSDVPPPQGAKPLSEITIISPPLADIERQLRPNIEKWRDTFGM